MPGKNIAAYQQIYHVPEKPAIYMVRESGPEPQTQTATAAVYVRSTDRLRPACM